QRRARRGRLHHHSAPEAGGRHAGRTGAAVVKVADWLDHARGDALRRGLDDLVPLLENVARSMTVLRTTDWDLASRAPAAGQEPGPGSGDAVPLSPRSLPSIATSAARLARGELTSERLTEECLARIEALNPQLNAFVTVTADSALEAARA